MQFIILHFSSFRLLALSGVIISFSYFSTDVLFLSVNYAIFLCPLHNVALFVMVAVLVLVITASIIDILNQ